MKLILKAFVLTHLLTLAQASENESSLQQLRRKLSVATKNFGRNHSGNLGLCEGDCNNDSECKGALVCHQRDAGDNAPGCTLSSNHRKSRVDFCVVKQGGTPTAPTPVKAPVVAPTVPSPVVAPTPVKAPVVVPTVPSPVVAPTPVTAPVVAPTVPSPVVAPTPVKAPVVPPPPPTASVNAVLVGNNNVRNLALCQGDCDRNEDCASGLKCFQRGRGKAVPGCKLSMSLMDSEADFCVKA